MPRRPLDVIEVKQPCPMSWEQMRGDDTRRFCAHCNKHVHNLSAMPADEAEKLVCSAAGELCVRYARDPVTQQVMTLDYQPKFVPSRRRVIAVMLSILSACGISGAWAANKLLRKPAPPPPPAPTFVAGAMLMPTPSTSPVNPTCDPK